MKFKELKNKSDKELQKLLQDFQEKSRELRFKTFADQLKNVRELREVKKVIARILFLIGEKKTTTPKKFVKGESQPESDAPKEHVSGGESKVEDKAKETK